MSKFLKHTYPPGRLQPVQIDHWDALFDAVVYRLRHAVNDPMAPHVRATVLECTEDLIRLQAPLGWRQTGPAFFEDVPGPVAPNASSTAGPCRYEACGTSAK